MTSEIILKLVDLSLPNLPAAPITSVGFQQAAIRAIENEYSVFRRYGKLEVKIQGEFIHIKLTGDDNLNLIDVAISELTAGRIPEGVSILQFIHASSPDDYRVLYLLGSALSDTGDLKRAVVFLQRALEIRPQFPEALVNLGVALSRMNRMEDAIEYLKRAVHIDQENAHAHRNLGACLAKVGRDFPAAQNHLENAVRLSPTDLQSWFGLAGVYKVLGRTTAARNACGKILQMAPESQLANYARAMLCQM